MKRIKNIALMGIALSAATLTACQTDFAEINTDHRHPTEKDLEMDNLNSGGLVTALEENIFPVGNSGTGYVNEYQVAYTLSSSCWMGYIAPTQNKWEGTLPPTFALKQRSKQTYDDMAGKVYQSWLELKDKLKNDPAAFAVGQIIKIAAVHKAADTFGPIPYSKAAIKGSSQTEYDAQEDVYKQMLEELDAAVTALSNNKHNVFTRYDVIYEGDYNKWMKFANSLMLRLAMRCYYANEEMSKTYVQKACTNPGGLIAVASEGAKLCKGAGIQYKNPLVIINDPGYNDARMGAEIGTYLQGYNDPRLSVYFTKGNYKGKSGYYGVRTNMPKVDSYIKVGEFSQLNVQNETPLYIMRASEVEFLLAEAALRKMLGVQGDAKSHYEKGIKLSFEENGIAASEFGKYIAQKDAKQAKFEDVANSQYSTAAVSEITIPWANNADLETNLERIITQKYLALYPDGQEAWSEYRRTGYPKIFPAVANHTDCGVDGNKRPTRIPYSNEEYTDNNANILKAVQLLGGAGDLGSTRVWWDKKPNK